MVLAVRDHIPLKQGLRHTGGWSSSCCDTWVRDHIPLKQGLRHFIQSKGNKNLIVRDHIPLKQGLRRIHSCMRESLLLRGPRPYSIKTRIKTNLCASLICRRFRPRPYSIKTRIKTALTFAITITITVRDHIPLKQGLRLTFRYFIR